MRSGRRYVVVLLACGALLASALAVRAATTAPSRQGDAPPLETFDPETVGRLEQEAWAAYYFRDWPRLFGLLLELIEGQFGLSPAQALEAATVATRAQVVFAERGADDGAAEDYMRQFYTLVKAPSGGTYDPARAAELELRWWVIHRNRAQYPDTTALADALAALYAEVYRVAPSAGLAAGEHRALAMEASDRWIAEGRDPRSPLLVTVRDELVLSYRALAAAIAARGS